MRKITTAAELDEVPDGSIVVDDEDVAYQSVSRGDWRPAGASRSVTSAKLLAQVDTLHLVWTPKDGAR